jgi:hypothetical protein
MEPYSDAAAQLFKLNSSDDWLRKWQGLALPALPPTTLESCRYFFSKIRVFTGLAASNGKGRIDYEAFAQEWNQSANGKDRFYITTDVLSAYAKSWEKITNIQASQELISHQMETIHKTSTIFAAVHQSFPDFLTDTPTSVQPSQGLIDLDNDSLVPPSLSVDLPISLPHVPIPYIPPSPPHPLVPPPEDQSDTPSMPPVLPLIFVPPSNITCTESQNSMCVINFLILSSVTQSDVIETLKMLGPRNAVESFQMINADA